MILQAMARYYERLLRDPGSGVAPAGYSQEKIGFEVLLSRGGEVVQVNDIRVPGKKPQPRLLAVPQGQTRASAIRPNFLWDKTAYVLGVSASSKRVADEHTAFRNLHLDRLAETDDEALRALRGFLEQWAPERFREHPAFASHADAMLDANLVFRLDGERGYVHERQAARALVAALASPQDAGTAMCLVTGTQSAPARLHPVIKNVNGAQSSGASIVSFNLDAFTSYGRQQGENAPVSQAAAFAYTTALNHLLRRDAEHGQRLQLGDTTVVFWAEAYDDAAAAAAEDMFANIVDPPTDAQESRALGDALERYRQGQPLRTIDPRIDPGTRLYVLGLAPNASRLSIRLWETGTLEAFADRIARHYDDVRLEPPPFKHPPPMWWWLLATVPHRENAKPKSDDIPPQLAGDFARAVFTGARYPQSLLGALVMRMRADGNVEPRRIALCKAVLARLHRLDPSPHRKEPSVSLDPDNHDAGYLLGRLFSTLENVQQAALGGQINATIRDRYYGAASATPALVFPMLMRNAQNHLARLRKEKPGLGVVLEKEVGQIVDALPTAFPRSLRIEAQGHFAIGYYHQMQARYARAGAHDPNESTSNLEGEAA